MSDEKTLYELMKRFNTAMLITRSSEQDLHARPMAIAGLEESLEVWFFTHRSEKVEELEESPEVQVCCQSDRECYVALSGTAEVTDDRAKVRELWREPFRVWFPKGTDDPDLLLIRVRPRIGEYWDNSGTKRLSYLFKAAAAYVTGTTPAVDKEHGKTVL